MFFFLIQFFAIYLQTADYKNAFDTVYIFDVGINSANAYLSSFFLQFTNGKINRLYVISPLQDLHY